jgi:hypothetical protein
MSLATAITLLAASAYAPPPPASNPPAPPPAQARSASTSADAIRAVELDAILSPAPGFDLGPPAQIVNPADKQKKEGTPPGAADQVSTTTVTARAVSEYREEDRFGPYDQPLWTAFRRFPTTRIYVRPPGTFEFEYWKRVDIPHGGGPAEVQTQYEFEVGLPGRFQVDMYLLAVQEGNDGTQASGEQFEVRWAFADWDKIWGNPTLYLEVSSLQGEPDTIEGKLLLGGEMSPGWHWGTNLVFERETSGDLSNNHEITAGVSRTMADEQWSLGGEFKASLTNTHADRSDYQEELLVGPSLQYRPLKNVHLDLATLAGIGGDSPDFEGFFVLGYEF